MKVILACCKLIFQHGQLTQRILRCRDLCYESSFMITNEFLMRGRVLTSRTAALVVLWADPTSAPPLSILDFPRPLPLKNFCDARRSEILKAPNLQLYIPHNVCARHNNTSSWYVCALTHTVILLTFSSGTAGQIRPRNLALPLQLADAHSRRKEPMGRP
jgi:hypothetical protein